MSFASQDIDQAGRYAGRPAPKVRLADLAQMAGVSVATVSRSLQDSPLINRMTKLRIRQLAADNGYVLDDGAYATTYAQRVTVGVMMPALMEAAPQFLLPGLIQASRDLRCNLLLSTLRPDAWRNLPMVLEMVRADAFIFLDDRDLRPALSDLARSGKSRFIVWGAGPTSNYRNMGPDNFGAAVAAVNHLVAKGCRRIAYYGDTQGSETTQRFMGYLTALNENGLAVDASLVLSSLHGQAVAYDGLLIADEGLVSHTWRAQLAGTEIVTWGNAPTPEPVATLTFDGVEAGRRILSSLLEQKDLDITHERIPLNLKLN